jgi:hypothetical protein
MLHKTKEITKELHETEEMITKNSVRQAKLQLRESETAEIKFPESCNV